jgi:hypothetical protein
MPSWDEELPTTPTSTVHEGGTSRTSKERCKRCGERAAARCVGCGAAFCKTCVDPVSNRAPEITCRACVTSGAVASNASSPALLEQAVERCLARLAAKDPTPLVRAMRKEALECQVAIDDWRAAVPDAGARDAMRERVLGLYARIEQAG